MKKVISFTLVFVLGLTMGAAKAASNNQAPIAEAGLPRYAAIETVVLDGTSSYDPDESGILSYTWQQVSGPSIVISDANTATPIISGFVQTDEIQECVFELVVSDGELTSLPDTVKVIIVSDFGDSTLQLENPSFDPNKPTLIYFGGGNCMTGAGQISLTGWSNPPNIIDFPNGYEPDSSDSLNNEYYHYGDMLIIYLSSVAPNYTQPIQTSGWSTGGMPAIDVALRLNLTYKDARYAVNQVTFLDAACRVYSKSILNLLTSSIDGECCWIDNYVSTEASFYPNILNVGFSLGHSGPPNWYFNSLRNPNSDMNQFNNGIVAGAYWSVIGPGKNLQLASTPGVETYKFNWNGGTSSGYMDFYDEPNHPGRLPEPVTLVGPEDGAFVNANGAIFSCEISENSIEYLLLFGCDPYHMVYLLSDTPTPPVEQVAIFPFEKTWWTVKAYDQYGSTIYADPICIIAEDVIPQTIENITTAKQYPSIQQAVNDALDGQEIVISPGIYPHCENIDFKGKNLTLRSIDPNDPNVVANTVIKGSNQGPTITLSNSDNRNIGSVLAGLTIFGGTVGISCSDTSPKIQNCTVGHHGSIAIEFWDLYEPTIIDCNILGQINELIDPRLAACWPLDETEGTIAYDSAGEYDGTLHGDPHWLPEGGIVDGAIELDGINDYVITPFVLNPATGSFSVFAWVKGGAPGQVIISQADGVNWLSVDVLDGTLMTELRNIGRSAGPLRSQTIITDGDWHRVGITWDGTNRILYVDDTEVASDTQDGLNGSSGGLYIGAGNVLDTGSFWSGLIDDVRIYNRTITP
jgi:hypothetical protein